MWNEIAAAFQQGDVIMYAMLAIAFIGTTIFMERFVMLQFVFNIDFKKFLTNIKKMIKAEDIDRAVNHCRNTKHTSLPLIGLRALEAGEADPSTIKGTIEEETISFLPRVERRLGALPALAILTLLLGILGTINALFATFHSIDILDTAQKQAAIGHNVANSLSYTTFGLVICMLFLFGNQILRGMAMRLVDQIQLGVTVLTNLLVPQEVAMMPVGMMAGAAPDSGLGLGLSNDTPIIDNPTAAATPVAAAAVNEEDDFDDTSIEDIKDEEEII